jgi:hypothetical protein
MLNTQCVTQCSVSDTTKKIHGKEITRQPSSSLLAVSAFFLDWSPKSATHRHPGYRHYSDDHRQDANKPKPTIHCPSSFHPRKQSSADAAHNVPFGPIKSPRLGPFGISKDQGPYLRKFYILLCELPRPAIRRERDRYDLNDFTCDDQAVFRSSGLRPADLSSRSAFGGDVAGCAQHRP